MNHFSEVVMDHFLHPRGATPLVHVSGEGWAGAPEARRYMRIQVQVVDDTVVAASFGTYGCAPAIAAGSFICEWATGRSVDEADTMTAEQLEHALGGLPDSRRFCAGLAVDALREALRMAVRPIDREALVD